MLKKLYKQACDIERDVLAKIEKWTADGSASVLYDNPDFPPRYLTPTSPPMFIRHVVSVNDAQRYAQIYDNSMAMRDYYKQYVIAKAHGTPSAFKGYPRRFVHCVKDIMLGRIVEKQSFRQESDKGESKFSMLPIVSVRARWDRALSKDEKIQELLKSVEELKSVNIDAQYVDGTLYASAQGIREFGSAKGLSIRIPSGTQYRIHLQSMDPGVKAKTLPVGFIVAENKFTIVQGHRETHNRKSTIENIKKEIKLPIYTGSRTFWRRED
ncbi:MAG: hypothetical protein QM504_06705 [Pseudomonadota bacterium]